MAYYLVSAIPHWALIGDLRARLAKGEFLSLQPFGRALTSALLNARRLPDGSAVWEEEDHHGIPPLAQERAAVLDRYFEALQAEPVEGRGKGWERIIDLPSLFMPAVLEPR